ncbi:MAG: spore coat protein [Bacillota bacterium]
MASFIDQIFRETTDKSLDQTLAVNSKASTAASATAYFMAALEATTPEVRRLFSEYAIQCSMAQESLAELTIQRGWVNPYDNPTSQLSSTVKQSSDMVSGTAQQ